MKTKIKRIILTQKVVNRFLKEERFYMETYVELESPYSEPCTISLRGGHHKVGDYINWTIKPLTERFTERLKGIGVSVELSGNCPFIYVDYVNGKKVTEKFQACHGFTAFFMGRSGVHFSDRREVFKMIRKMLNNS